MQTNHKIIASDSRRMPDIEDETIDLVVTSPPYPMIEMWDTTFSELNPEIGIALNACKGAEAFEAMHQELDKVWKELARAVRPNGFVCINIGDATRTIGKQFQLYSNHSRITTAFTALNFHPLPVALWKKSTNAPNKFMGSGMLPAGAYITLEHEYILVFRKGGKREFKTPELKRRRKKSAFFWEERNTWFSDTWGLKGARQATGDKTIRERNAAYPIDLPYRLINMYSTIGDTILDPFLGTGTSLFAAIASGRDSVGLEIDPNFLPVVDKAIPGAIPLANDITDKRLIDHIAFVKQYKKEFKHRNNYFGLPVVTSQETELELHHVSEISGSAESGYTATYKPIDMTKLPN